MCKTELSVKKITQNQYEFFIGSFPISFFKKFTRYTSRLIIDFDDEGTPIYNNQIQRKTDNSKVNKISDFLIYDPNAFFPTNVVVGIPLEVINQIDFIDNNDYIFTLDNIVQEQIANAETPYLTIIDGQHRIRGIEKALERLNKEDLPINKAEVEKRINDLELVVSFFIGPSLEFQANIFSTINRTQTKVTESLVYSLFGLTDDSSPYRSALEITLALNGKVDSPFYNRIKLYGNYKKGTSPTLSQATMVKSIVKFISKNFREAEKEKFIPRDKIDKGDQRSLPFRKFYVENKDESIAKILNAYFSAVREVFIDEKGKPYWDFYPGQKEADNILQTTVGYSSLLEILKDILSIIDSEFIFQKDVYVEILSTVEGIDFTDREKYPYTAKTKTTFMKDIQLELLSYSDQFHKEIARKLGINGSE